MTRGLSPAAVLVLACSCAFAADEVLTVSGEIMKGSALIEAGSLRMGGGSVSLNDVISIRFAESARFASINQGIVTVGGDIISGTVSDLNEGQVSISSDLFGPMKIAKDRVRLVSLRPTPIATLTTFASDFEGVVLSNDDRAGGEITWMSEEEIGVKTRAGIFRIPRKRARLISFGSADKAKEGTQQLYVRLMNGDLVAVQSPRLTAEELSFTSALGKDLKIGREMLYEVFNSGGRVVHLSDLKPASAVHVPQFDAKFPHRIDSSVGGGMLTVGDRSYPRGLGVHSRSVIEFDLGGNYTMLLAEIGIDEEVGDRGSVVFRIKVDGNEVFASGSITGKMGPQRAKAALGSGKKLTLEVDFGPDDADAGDHADWCMPVLIRR